MLAALLAVVLRGWAANAFFWVVVLAIGVIVYLVADGIVQWFWPDD